MWSTVLLVSISLSSTQIFINSFLLLGVCFICCSLSSSFWCEVNLCIWVFPNFLRDTCIAMYFPHRTAFAISPKFWMVVSSFSLVSMNVFNSSIISWLTLSSFSRMLFSLHVFEFLLNFFLWLSSSFKALWSENIRGQSQSFGISWDLICDPVCGLFWRKF